MSLRRLGVPVPLLALFACAVLVLAACGDDEEPGGGAGPGLAASVTPAALTVSSSAFEDGGVIDEKYRCGAGGLGVSPPIAWTGAPEGTESFAILMNDPFGVIGDFTHWLVFGIPGDVMSLEEDAASGDLGGGQHALNNIEQLGYFGPCPQPGDTAEHTYHIRVLALDYVPDIDAASTFRAQFEQEIIGHILATGELTGVVPAP